MAASDPNGVGERARQLASELQDNINTRYLTTVRWVVVFSVAGLLLLVSYAFGRSGAIHECQDQRLTNVEQRLNVMQR